ncbi:hypothetical protein OPV22_034340 [Ensete ventricosum]|uniref:Bowman-Birk serine protease inhibitors family domain-containing protein n=1 Tax=Ensete ventricosum TaxID=4639 RepID=A0AAV8Q4I9_ENSVE|nr:hypothetical protein OPV22_034340 [Ensete ventricosum]RWW03312.1 hypothetical protein GW17_00033538 [Ensete ventricosum]
MALSRAAATVAAAVLIAAALLVAASTERAMALSDDPYLCYCPCMQDQCMTIDAATKKECARACDAGCREAGLPGQPNRFEFCGF